MHERSIQLEGAINLRDFGGYDTRDGRQVRRGRLFRSGSLARLTGESQRTFSQLGIGLICDLRRPSEKQSEPTALPLDTPRRLEIPIHPGSAALLYQEMDRGDLSLQQGIDFMVSINQELARNHIEDYAQMFSGLLDLKNEGFLVHCSAGKDRTGFACALILHALGVPQETVLEDYLLTNQTLDFDGYIVPALLARCGNRQNPSRESVMTIAGVRPEYLMAAYQAIESEFEGVEHYLEQAIGLDAAAREQLRLQLLDEV